jgi:hypothetical protein
MSNGSEQDNESRRTLLKHLVAAGGAAIGAAATLPDTWVKPVVDAVIVPLHAQTSPGIINPIALGGNWSGSWNDTVQGTSGTATMSVTVDANAGTFAISLDLNGPVLASADPAPQPFTGTFTTSGGTIASQVVPRFGVPSITISPTGVITGSLAPLPEAGAIQINGTVTSTTLVINYTANRSMPTPLTFAGTLTMTK